MGFAIDRFSVPPAKNFVCWSCGGVYDDPWNVCAKQELHLVCFECFNERGIATVTIEGRESFVGCLKCGTPVNTDLQKPERSVAREVDHLQLHCSHKSAGCSWVGTVADVWEHEKNCSEKIATCANDGCDVSLKLPALVLHRKDVCPLQKIACWRGNFDGRNHCIVLRKDLPGHATHCQFHQCPVMDCTTRGPLPTIASHVDQCTEYQGRRIKNAADLIYLEENLREATDRISELESEVEETEEAYDDLEQECHLVCQGLEDVETRNKKLTKANKKLTEDLDKAKSKLPSKASTWIALGRHPDDYAAALLRTETRLAKAETKLAKREREIRRLKREMGGDSTDDDKGTTAGADDGKQRPAKRARFADEHGGQLVVKKEIGNPGSPDL